jgi:hypothetical protein
VPITAIPNPGFAFESWTGSGNGSYTGAENPATIVMNGPITESAAYHPFGFNFSISASSTDPFVNASPPAGTIRSLHLWTTCAEEGLSAFQGTVTGSLAPLAFAPATGVFNLGTATALLLAIGGCPTGDEVAVRLGEWFVVDSGGSICFTPSTPNALFAAVDCDQVAPTLLENPRVLGFSSSGAPPCFLDENPCWESGPPPESDLARGQLPPPAPVVDAFHGIRPNPFQARTATISIYDVSGRLVRRLVNGMLDSGEHQLRWDGRTSQGEVTPAGVYFLRVEAGSLSQTAKVVALRAR